MGLKAREKTMGATRNGATPASSKVSDQYCFTDRRAQSSLSAVGTLVTEANRASH